MLSLSPSISDMADGFMTFSIDSMAIRSALFHDGYFVVPGLVSREMCKAVVEAIGMQLGIRIDDESTWSKVSGHVDQVPLWGDQSQWDIRQLPEIHAIWSSIWGTPRLWVSRDSCRFTIPWQPGRADAQPLHWDLDPWDRSSQMYQGLVALTDCPARSGGFRCSPAIMGNRDRWPTTWPTKPWGTEWVPHGARDDEIVEVPLNVGDLLIWDSHLPHGTVRNEASTPRLVFYLMMFPAGTANEAAVNVADHEAGLAPEYWRWKPGHDRAEPGPPATLSELGRRLLGLDPWGGDE